MNKGGRRERAPKLHQHTLCSSKQKLQFVWFGQNIQGKKVEIVEWLMRRNPLPSVPFSAALKDTQEGKCYRVIYREAQRKRLEISILATGT